MATLAPPLASTHSRKERLAAPKPAPAGSRPQKHRMFPIGNLIKVPLRVLSPPKATGMVGSVRSLKSTPLNDVKLADVIANKHLSPLSLKDFEVSVVDRILRTGVRSELTRASHNDARRTRPGLPRVQRVLG